MYSDKARRRRLTYETVHIRTLQNDRILRTLILSKGFGDYVDMKSLRRVDSACQRLQDEWMHSDSHSGVCEGQRDPSLFPASSLNGILTCVPVLWVLWSEQIVTERRGHVFLAIHLVPKWFARFRRGQFHTAHGSLSTCCFRIVYGFTLDDLSCHLDKLPDFASVKASSDRLAILRTKSADVGWIYRRSYQSTDCMVVNLMAHYNATSIACLLTNQMIHLLPVLPNNEKAPSSSTSYAHSLHQRLELRSVWKSTIRYPLDTIPISAVVEPTTSMASERRLSFQRLSILSSNKNHQHIFTREKVVLQEDDNRMTVEAQFPAAVYQFEI
ncbi:uncharacterized protein ARMOST_17995 [Armillaria ostoyae]|uniref:Uncharacterized protein n=1 Tax=Armillaria ostoyae TaxID=47428 RepID=A0A284S0I9_ARMOS|nr:uncharacterized protein ARMOST_17995 [Armillaria ostoyae]